MHILVKLSIVFFQAEDGIRDGHVTGVQTCTLPISRKYRLTRLRPGRNDSALSANVSSWGARSSMVVRSSDRLLETRSEERRVGKECGSRRGGGRAREKKQDRTEDEPVRGQ